MWKVWAFSPRDGGWVRWFGPEGFKDFSVAWQSINMFRTLSRIYGDYRGFMVKQVIVFHVVSKRRAKPQDLSESFGHLEIND